MYIFCVTKKEEIKIGIPVLILGESGSGKTASLRNFDKSEVLVFNVANKPLPFRGNIQKVNLRDANYSERYHIIKQYISKFRDKVKVYIIDDSQYLMSLEEMDRVAERGFDKYTEIAKKFIDLVEFCSSSTPEDVIVYFLHHTEISDEGKIKAKTVGKLIDNHIVLEGLYSIIIRAVNHDGNYQFLTRSDGGDTVKTPMEMFESKEIDNDLKIVDQTIRDYYKLGKGREERII